MDKKMCLDEVNRKILEVVNSANIKRKYKPYKIKAILLASETVVEFFKQDFPDCDELSLSNKLLEIIRSFKEYNLQFVISKNPKRFFRRGYKDEPKSKYGLGSWFSEKERTIEEARDELSILASWGSPLTGTYWISTPKGTMFLEGVAASQIKGEEYRPGGGSQVYIPNAGIYLSKTIIKEMRT